MSRLRLDPIFRTAGLAFVAAVVVAGCTSTSTSGHGTPSATSAPVTSSSPTGGGGGGGQSSAAATSAAATATSAASKGAGTSTGQSPNGTTSQASSSSSQTPPFAGVNVTGESSGGGTSSSFHLPAGSYVATVELKNKCRYMLTLVQADGSYSIKFLETATPVASPPLEEHAPIDPVPEGMYYIDSATNAPAPYCPYSVYIR